MRATQKIRIGAVLTIVSILAMPRTVVAQAEAETTLASTLADKWEEMRRTYVEVRWLYLPGFRMTKAKTQELLDVALRDADA